MPPLPNIPRAAAPPSEEVDVAIIGAGMTGCAVAHWMRVLNASESVVVLDARGVAGGATGRNGGHLWQNPDSAFEKDTTDELLEFIRERQVQCDLQLGGAAALTRRNAETGVTYFDAEDDPEAAAESEEWGASLASWDVDTCRAKLQTDAFIDAEVYPDAAQFYPARVAAALLDASGATLVAPVRVVGLVDVAANDGGRGGGGQDGGVAHCAVSWERDEADGAAATSISPSTDGVRAAASGVLRARRVVVATNGWAPELLPELTSHVYPTRNQVIMTAPLPNALGLQVGGFSVDGEHGARELYCIRRPDGRVCLGGARALEPDAAVGSSDDATLSDEVGRYLRRFLREQLPALTRVEGVDDEAGEGAADDRGGDELPIEAEWTGVLGFTGDGKPLVGPLPARPHVHVAVGFCGHGMPQCFGVGKAIAQMLAGRPDDELHPHMRTAARVGRVFGGE